MTDLVTTDLVRLDADFGSTKHDVIRALAGVVDEAGRATDAGQLVEDALARKATSSTGMPGAIAIPHCRTTGVKVPTLAFARLEPPCGSRRQGRSRHPRVPGRGPRRGATPRT